MKTILLATLAVLGLAFTSCNKCTTCECTATTEWTFDEGFDESVEASIRSQYEKEFEEDYPAIPASEICARRGGQYNDTILAFENQSYFLFEESSVGDDDWSVDYNRNCTCEE